MNLSQEVQSLAAKGAVLSLDRVADSVTGSVTDQIALKDAELRQWMARWMVWLFAIANVMVLAVIAGLVWLDQGNLGAKLIAPGDRIIGNQVVMTLIGATTVQVGTIAVIIARYLFPSSVSAGEG